MEKHRRTPPPVPFKLICTLRGVIGSLEDAETTLQRGRTATPAEVVSKHSDNNGVVLDPVMIVPDQLMLQDERTMQEIQEAWSPQDGFQRDPVKLSVKVSDSLHLPGVCQDIVVRCGTCRIYTRTFSRKF